MQSIAEKQAQTDFGALLDAAQRGPVAIEKHGASVAVIMSRQEYERLEALDDAWWGARAEAADREGFLGPEEGEQWLTGVLGAEA